jgi:hypothetical protein
MRVERIPRLTVPLERAVHVLEVLAHPEVRDAVASLDGSWNGGLDGSTCLEPCHLRAEGEPASLEWVSTSLSDTAPSLFQDERSR